MGMSSWPRLSKAPITEAVFDINVQLPPDVRGEELAKAHDLLRTEFPVRRIRRTLAAHIDFGGEKGSVVEERGPDGYLFVSADEKRIVQFRNDGFSFNWLAPYDRWEVFRDQAFRFWEVYQTVARPTKVTRIALRYINRLRLPLDGTNVSEYLNTYPKLPPTIQHTLAAYFMSLSTMDSSQRIKTSITQNLEEPPAGGGGDILILDIDAEIVSTRGARDQSIRTDFEHVRTEVKRVFFESITEKTQELYK